MEPILDKTLAHSRVYSKNLRSTGLKMAKLWIFKAGVGGEKWICSVCVLMGITGPIGL